MNVNVNGSYFCAREAAKDMIRRDAPGSIIMIGAPNLRHLCNHETDFDCPALGSMSGACVNIPQPQAPYSAAPPLLSAPHHADPMRTHRCLQGRRPPHGLVPCRRVGDQEHPRQRRLARIHGRAFPSPPALLRLTPTPLSLQTALTRVILERDPALREAWENLTPMGRIGEPEDLKVSFLEV